MTKNEALKNLIKSENLNEKKFLTLIHQWENKTGDIHNYRGTAPKVQCLIDALKEPVRLLERMPTFNRIWGQVEEILQA